MERVGILGGTFDPIHLGHLAAAEGVMHRLELKKVLFMPNRQPPHKAGRQISAVEHRSAMVKLAIAGNPRFAYSDLELSREGPSYTVDTVRMVRTAHPDWQAVFIVGMDSLLDIRTWHDYATLLTLTDLAVVARPGYAADRRDAVLASLGPALTARIRIVETPGVAVSASELRQLARQGYPLRYLVPAKVAEYIRLHRLYEP